MHEQVTYAARAPTPHVMYKSFIEKEQSTPLMDLDIQREFH